MNSFEFMAHTLDGYVAGGYDAWFSLNEDQSDQKEIEALALVESVMLPGIVVSKKQYKTKRKIVWETTEVA